MEGWIKIHRSISEHWIWKDPIKLKWWLDILLNVNHEDNKVNIGFDIYECKRGQSIRSLQKWAERWNCNKDTARNFLKLLEKDGMILHENVSKTTRITVCNYDTYQDDLHVRQTKVTRKTNDGQTMSDPNKNDKNEKKIINTVEFYKTEVEKAKLNSDSISNDYILFARHICAKGYNKEWQFPDVLKIEKQVSLNFFSKLHQKVSGNLETILGKVDSIQANKEYHNKYSDLYLTLNTWLNPRK